MLHVNRLTAHILNGLCFVCKPQKFQRTELPDIYLSGSRASLQTYYIQMLPRLYGMPNATRHTHTLLKLCCTNYTQIICHVLCSLKAHYAAPSSLSRSSLSSYTALPNEQQKHKKKKQHTHPSLAAAKAISQKSHRGVVRKIVLSLLSMPAINHRTLECVGLSSVVVLCFVYYFASPLRCGSNRPTRWVCVFIPFRAAH